MIISNSFQSLLNLGELHPLLVHFPIAICFLLGLIELVSLKKGRDSYLSASHLLLWVFLISSFLTVALGLLWHEQLGDESQLMEWHKYAGLATLFFSVCCLIAYRYKEFTSYRIFLLLSIALVSLAGHWGGEMSHGKVEQKNEPINIKPIAKDSLQQIDLLAQQILKNHCIDCHNAKKSKGKLRLDDLSLALKGGKNGPALVLGHPEKSEMIRRIKLPASHDDAMPTKGERLKPQEIALLEEWIKNKEASFPLEKDEHKRSIGILDAPFEPMIQSVRNTQLDEAQIAELSIKVRGILAHSCYSCHNATKTKGGLRLDKKEFIFKGGDDGPIVVLGFPEKSEMIRRIKLPDGHEDAMPTKGKRLTADEIGLLEYWIKEGAPWPNGPEKSLYRVAAMSPRLPKLLAANKEATQPIDRIVFQYFRQKGLKWGQPINDIQFIRRVYWDIVGLLPTPEKVHAFEQNKDLQKREKLVDELLNQNNLYAQHWLSFWNDLLRNDYAGPGYIDGGRAPIGKWLYQSLKTNKSYNQLVRELIAPPQKDSEGFIKGIVWRGTVNSSQSPPMQAAQNVAQVFMGLNLKCASCHDSFISDWKLEDSYGFANVFANQILEIHKCDMPTGKKAGFSVLYPELGSINTNAITADRLKELANIWVNQKNGRLYRTIVNRYWAQLMGRGLVEPVDAMDNAPWSQDLLDWLAYDFAANGADLKGLLKTIMLSKTYQMQTVGVKSAEWVVSNQFVFKGPVRRRLSAEQFADGFSQVFQPMYTDSMIAHKQLSKEIFKDIPFPRASLVKNDAFQTALGRPTRENVTTNRNAQANLLQALELTNGISFNKALQEGSNHWVKKYPESEQLVKQLYEVVLNRKPSIKELQFAVRYLGKSASVSGVQDLAWVLFLLPEYQFIP